MPASNKPPIGIAGLSDFPSSVQHRVWITLGCPCLCDRPLAVQGDELSLGIMAGQDRGRQFVERGTDLLEFAAQVRQSHWCWKLSA